MFSMTPYSIPALVCLLYCTATVSSAPQMFIWNCPECPYSTKVTNAGKVCCTMYIFNCCMLTQFSKQEIFEDLFTEGGGEGDPHPFYLRPADDVTKWDLQHVLTPMPSDPHPFCLKAKCLNFYR